MSLRINALPFIFMAMFLFVFPIFLTISFASAAASSAPVYVYVAMGSGGVAIISGNTYLKTLAVQAPGTQLTYASNVQKIFAPSQALSGKGGSGFSVINTQTNKIVARIKTGFGDAKGALYVPSTKSVFITDQLNGVVDEINAATYKVVASIKVPSPYNLGYSPANNELYVGSWGGSPLGSSSNSVQVIDLTTNSVIKTLNFNGFAPFGFGYDPANGEMYVGTFSSGQYGEVVAIDSGNKIVKTFSSTFGNVYNFAFNPNNKDMYVTEDNVDVHSNVTLIDSSNHIVATVTGYFLLTGIVYNPSNQEMYFGDQNTADVYPLVGTTVGSPISICCEPKGMAVS